MRKLIIFLLSFTVSLMAYDVSIDNKCSGLKRKFFILQREAKSNRTGLWDRYRKVMECLK